MSNKTINVSYFALMREQSGRSSESVSTSAVTAQELYDELRVRHAFTLPDAMLKVVVNEEFCPWDAPLADGDTVVFVPPVAGG